MPARVNNPRAADQLRREYSVMGDRLNMTVDDVVVPVAVVADLSAGSSGVPTVRRAYASFVQAAVVGEYPVWRLEIPPGFIVVVNRIRIVAGAALARCHFGASFAVAPTTVAPNTQLMDGRLRADLAMTPAANLVHDTQIPLLAPPFHYVQAAAAAGWETITEWPFGRAQLWDFIEFQYPAMNVLTTVSMEWDEVPVSV